MNPSDWPLSTVRLVDADLIEWFVWTGWGYPEALHDILNVDATRPWRVQIITPPDEHYE